MLPSLYEHRCSEGRPGGFFERVKRGTWLGHVAEHVALEIQSLAGMPCGYGRTRSTSVNGVYNVVFTYVVESAGIYAAKAAVRIVEALVHDQPYDLQKDIDELKEINREEGLGPTTQAIVNAAKRRKIPYRRLNDDSLVLLGQGVYQKKIQAAMASTTSAIAMETASNKKETKRILQEAFIPVPEGTSVRTLEGLKQAVNELGFPLAIKPLNGNHGRGITTNINTWEDAEKAFDKASAISHHVLVERFINGFDFRFLVINYKLEAVARRTPAMIMGDGQSTIQALIDKTNNEEARGEGHEKTLTKIKVDDQTRNILKEKNLALHSILPFGEILILKDTANLSSGGTARDTTDIVHPYNVFLAERIARIMNLDICGIDIIAEDITSPITAKNGAVLEVNAAPGFRMHLSPSKGMPRDVGEPVIRMLYPPGAPSRIPIVAVTGTNGKTTTTRIISHLAREAGHNVGFTTTEGIYINNQQIYKGDCSGPASAQVVLRDPLVDFAVLECARGGILRSGLGFDKCNISIITNISEDHLGLNDIHDLDDLARVKSVVARSTFDDGYAILNADDDIVYGLKDELDCNIALFSIHDNNPRVNAHCEQGGWAAIIERGYFTLCKGEWRTRIGKVSEVPLTFNGRATSMIKNILPAVLAATLSEFNIEVIRKSLLSFTPGPENTPGRMNIFDVRDFKVMIDFAHNTRGYEELKDFLAQINASEKIGIVAATGDRRDIDIESMGSCAAEMFDRIIIRHDEDGRGRTNEELTNLLSAGIKKVKPNMPITVISKELEAIDYAIKHADKGAFIVACSDEIEKSIAFVKNIIETELQSDDSLSPTF